MAELISVIVATYDREDALDAVLRGLSRQRDRGFEVLVADDGSGPVTAEVIAQWRSRAAFPFAHVRHEDQGFRLAEIRNRAILQSAGAVCIFLDGDCIPRPGFVAAHRRLAAPGWFVAGNRVLLGQALTARILREHLEPELWSLGEWLRHRLRGEVNRLLPLLPLPLGALRRLGPASWRSARGTNLAIRREDLARVDGFDATFNGWGREDSDIMVRLIRAGVRRKDGRYATAVLHLWHPDFDRSRLPDNERRLADVISGDRVRALRGLSTLAV
ncbi:MAG TPA: glycosyltransferase [Xanthobacteraceae bacterium]|nr:glycosyltransferase [Xanthobacteraceae bacterium]